MPGENPRLSSPSSLTSLLSENSYRAVLLLGVAARAAQLLVSWIFSVSFQRFDKSTELYSNGSPFRLLLSWDAMHFLHIADHGYTYEHAMPFFPLLPLVVRYLPLPAGNLTKAVLFNCACSVVSALLLYKITMRKYHASIAFLSAVFFIMNPSHVIYSSFYTEPLFCLLFLLGLFFLSTGRMFRASTFIGLCSLTRSNTVLFLLFFRVLFWPVALAPLALYQLYCLLLMCRLKCSFRIFVPYSYIQKVYWNQGFLRFIRIHQIPNMLFGLPAIFQAYHTIRVYLLAKLPLLEGVDQKQAEEGSKGVKPVDTEKKLIPLILSCTKLCVGHLRSRLRSSSHLWDILTDPFSVDSTSDTTKLVIILALQLLVLLLFAHWNMAYRFLSYNPVLYWAMAIWAKHAAHTSAFRTAVGIYIAYGVLYTLLFSTFYPPA